MNLSKKTTIISLTLITLIGLAVLGLVFWPGKETQNNNQEQNGVDVLNWKTFDKEDKELAILKINKNMTPDLIITEINNYFFSSSFAIKKEVADWIMDNDNRICLSDGVSLKINKIKSIEQINKEVSSFLEYLGFTKNIKNTYKANDNFRDSIIGIEKGDLKCIIMWPIDADRYMIKCANIKEQDRTNYDTFYNLVNNQNNKDALVCVEKQNDEYAKGSISFWRTGAEWYARKEDGKWNLLLTTQDSLYCSFAKQLPEGFYTDDFCYEDE